MHTLYVQVIRRAGSSDLAVFVHLIDQDQQSTRADLP